MKHTRINDRLYYYLLIALIGGLLLHNVFMLIYSKSIIAILSIASLSIIFFMLLFKNKFSKIITRIWTVIFLIGGPSLQIIGILLQYFGGNIEKLHSNKFFIAIVLLVFGLIIFELTNWIDYRRESKN